MEESNDLVNHHEIPNCNAVFAKNDSEIGEIKHIRIITLKDIKEGEDSKLL